MAAHIEGAVINQALAYLGTNGDQVNLCGTEPTNYTEANATFRLATATNGAGFTAPLFGAATVNGNNQRTTTAAIANATVNTTGTALWVAYSKSTATAALLVVMSMTSQVLTSGNTWSMAASTVDIPRQ